MKPLPGQLELATVIDHKKPNVTDIDSHKPDGIRLAKLLRDYDSRPTSDTWFRIQKLAAEILK
jgi:hypothetical protein